jgi:hypothetical protein
LVGEDLEEGVVAQVVVVVVVGVAGEQGVDLLGQEGLDGVADEERGPWVGESLGEVGDETPGAFQGADGEEAGIVTDAAAGEIDEELLRAHVPPGKVVAAFRCHDLGPPQWSKLLTSQDLDTARGSSHLPTVRNPG